MDSERLDAWYDRMLIDRVSENWVDIEFYDGYYQISNHGRVKSLQRYAGRRLIKEKILKQTICKDVSTVGLSKEGIKKTHDVLKLVGDAFLMIKEHKECYCHSNKIKYDNRLANISIKSFTNSIKLGYRLGKLSDWGIGSIPLANRKVFETHNQIIENGIKKQKCSRCDEIKIISEFYSTSSELSSRYCKECHMKQMGIKNIGKAKKEKQLAQDGFRKCWRCGEIKELNIDFGKNKNSYMGRASTCRECVRILNLYYREKKNKQQNHAQRSQPSIRKPSDTTY